MPADDRRAALANARWSERLEVTTPTFRTREPLLALRRALWRVFGDSRLEGETWLCLAKQARADRHFPTASSALLHAASLGVDEAVLERAKLLHDEGQVRSWALLIACTLTVTLDWSCVYACVSHQVDRAIVALEPVELSTEAVQARMATLSDDQRRNLVR